MIGVVAYLLAGRHMKLLAFWGLPMVMTGMLGYWILFSHPRPFFVRLSIVHPLIWGWVSFVMMLVGSAACIGVSARYLYSRFRKEST